MATPVAEGLSGDKVLVVVGRAPDLSHFAELASSLLFDNFQLVVAAPLEEEIGADGKLRFIGFVLGDEIEGRTIDNQAMRIQKTGGALGGKVYDNIELAMSDAKERYGFDNGSEELAARAERMEEMINKFPKFTVEEVEFGSLFDALITNGRLTLLRGLMDDEPVCTLAMVTSNEDETEIKFNVMAVLVTTPKIRSMIELPFTSI